MFPYFSFFTLFAYSFLELRIVFKSLHGLLPVYLSEWLQSYFPHHPFGSADQLLLKAQKAKCKLEGDHTFAAAAPILWNDLPIHVGQPSSIPVLKSSLKTHFFTWLSKHSKDAFLSLIPLHCKLFYWLCNVCVLFVNKRY